MTAREDVTLDSWGSRCAAWLYRPETDAARVPCVVMAHGWTGIREARLDAFAERLHAAGYGVLVFDYRHFGASEGEPRQLLDVRRQHEDYAAALTFARALPWVDAERVVLWGTSFSGGHVLTLAARDRRVAAVIALVPFVDGLRTLQRMDPRQALALTRAGLRDAAGAVRGRPPHLVASVGPPGSLAFMTSPDAEPGFHRMIPPGVDWPNASAGRIALRVGAYRPIRTVDRITAPVLYCLADDDVTTPADPALQAATRTPDAEVRRYAGMHFDPYFPPLFDEVAGDMVEFLRRRVPVEGSDGEGRTTSSGAATAA